MNWAVIFKVGVTGIGGFVGFLFGGWFLLLQVLLAFIVIDYITGMIASYIRGGLSSKIGSIGVAKKVVMLFAVMIAHLLDQIFGTKQVIRDGAIFFYLGNELLSFIENAGIMGLPLPPQVTNAVAVLKGKNKQ